MHYEIIPAEVDLGDLGLREANVHARWTRYSMSEISVNIEAIYVEFKGSGTAGGPPTISFNVYPHLNQSRLKAVEQIVADHIRSGIYSKHRSEGEVLPDVGA